MASSSLQLMRFPSPFDGWGKRLGVYLARGKTGANLASKLATCLKRSSNDDRLSAVWKALFSLADPCRDF